MLFTPEMSGLIDRDRTRAAAHLVPEAKTRCLPAFARRRRRMACGSISARWRCGKRMGGWPNRGYVIDDRGDVRARYDKMHLFDVDLPSGESWRESASYAPGEKAVVVDTPVGRLGLAICYDLRFRRCSPR